MSALWVVLFVALAGSHYGYGLPVRPTPQDYPHDGSTNFDGWGLDGGLYAAIPALALAVTAIILIFGCTWCYRHKDCKPNEGTDNQLFTASASHLHAAQRVPPPSSFPEAANNNISEDNNNGPISLREMQNIANNNAAAYIVSENEERNRYSRESIVEFEPLPAPYIDDDPLERCADWFGDDDFPRNNLQYLRELGRGWFGRVVVGEIEGPDSSTNVAVKILNQNVTLEQKAQFLDEAKIYRDGGHENILAFVGKCLQEEPWILMFELCTVDLQQYLISNRPNMAALNESGVPLRLMCDVTSALAYLHSREITYGQLWAGSVFTRGTGRGARAALGRYVASEPQYRSLPPEVASRHSHYNTSSEIWSLGTLIWEVCAWGSVPAEPPAPPPDLPCPYKDHLYQVMQLCWNLDPNARPSAAQVHALLSHLHATVSQHRPLSDTYASDFEDRWEKLKPNSIPKLDEHVAIIHAPSTSTSASASRYAGSDRESDHNNLGIEAEMVVSRSSSIMSDRDPLSVQLKSESLTNLHGSLEDVRNIYLTHNETPAMECHQGNILEDARERDLDRSDCSVDPWLKDIIAGSQDDVSYYKDVSDVIKNLDNILNSEKTSSSESSHQASPSRDNLSLDCKKEYPVQSSLVKSPGITNFQNILDTGFGGQPDEAVPCIEDEEDRDTIGTLSHSFERHSDSMSQHTLENITPDTPMKDFDVVADIEPIVANKVSDEVVKQKEEFKDIIVETKKSVKQHTELPKVVVSNIPKLTELCVASRPSVSDSDDLPLMSKDCQTLCDNVTEIRTDCEETKSIDDVRESITDSKPLDEIEVTDSVQSLKQIETKDLDQIILPISTDEAVHSIDGVDTLPSVTEEVSTQDNTSNIKLESNLEEIEQYSIESENNYSKDETILVSDLVDTVTDSSKDEQQQNHEEIVTVDIEVDSVTGQTPDSVQNIIDRKQETASLKQQLTQKAGADIVKHIDIMPTNLPPEIVQNAIPVPETEDLVNKDVIKESDKVDYKDSEAEIMDRSDSYVVINEKELSVDSTVYMDLINNTNSQIINTSTIDNTKEVNSDGDCLPNVSTIENQDSTEYLELPSFEVIKKTDDFLQMERAINSKHFEDKVVASTPITSDNSAETLDKTVENLVRDETVILSETKVLNASEDKQKLAPENISPYDSPSHKSHHTDTYDENSSVVLGPFENSSEMFKTKSKVEPVELPKEELLAFSSNFSEMNLATPSPLRDVNFLNDVPDLIPDDSQLEDLASISEPKLTAEIVSDETEGSGSDTQKRVSPSTPPNSPGIFLASTSQQKYLVDIDLNAHEPEPAPIIDLNQIELQITSKLAMAENENNLNIEYSGPLTVEGSIEEGGALRESDAIPESYLAGNGGSVEGIRQEELSLDEECVKALRNELELKLPLAQVAAIEPQCEGDSEWAPELPPPPELVVSYPGALSPIAEETGQQLSAYENDANWNLCTRTDSSESYPEPCNMSSESCTEAPQTAASPRTYTLPNDSAKPQKDLMSYTDSLNASPHESHDTTQSPVDDRTYVKDDKESNCERISQVSPFLVSPTTDTSDNDNATRVSTLSKTTLPTDAKHSKPETQCLSKATSIDSWCSNDTLYNVEENFDDLAMDPELPVEYEKEERDEHSDSTDTLTHNDDKELSHCSTYIIHDSKSEACDTFSPDSVTANDNNYTYTKVKTEAATATPSVLTKSDLNDSAKNTQTKDLAYGTLMSGLPSYSNCTTELASGFEEAWKLPQPELVRRSPMGHEADITSPKQTKVEICDENNSSPQLTRPEMKKMESVEIQCLQDVSANSPSDSEIKNCDSLDHESPNYNYKNMAPSVTSTPLFEMEPAEKVEAIPMTLPLTASESSTSIINVPTFLNFQQSAEVRPQDLSSNANDTRQESQVLLEGESKTLSRNSNRDSLIVSERTPTYSDFENSVVSKPQSINSINRSNQSMESGINSEEFRIFENSVKSRPQDLSSLIDASSLLLKSERMSSDLAMPNSKMNSANSNIESSASSERPTTYSDFENSAAYKPENTNSRNESHSITDIDINREEFQNFENSVNGRPQDLLSVVGASSSPKSENAPMELTVASVVEPQDQTSHLDKSMELMQSLDISPPSITNVIESQEIVVSEEPTSTMLINFDTEDETEQPHSIIVTEVPMNSSRTSRNRTNDSHNSLNYSDSNAYDLHENPSIFNQPKINGDVVEQPHSLIMVEETPSTSEAIQSEKHTVCDKIIEIKKDLLNGSLEIPKTVVHDISEGIKVNGGGEMYATVNFLNETFEELLESSVDDSDSKEDKLIIDEDALTPEATTELASEMEENLSQVEIKSPEAIPGSSTKAQEVKANGVRENDKMAAVTEDFLQNEKKYATLESYFPLLSDIRFTGPGTEMMSTSFQDSSTSPTSPECEQDSKPNTAAEILKEWDSDSESHSSNSSSGEFIWKDGAGHETPVVTTSHFEHQRDSGAPTGGGEAQGSGSGASVGSGDSGSGSGSEGDEVEFVPSSWDCRAAPAKSSLRSLEATPDSKKRVVFKRQKYHCVYEYPREAAEVGPHSPAYLPDLSTYCDWDPSSAEEAELCYGQLFSSPNALAGYPLRAGISFGSDYDEDFFISSSARPFESLGIMSTTSQFFPGKRALLERSLSDESPLQPASPPPVTTLDLTTPDSGVEDITPSSTVDEEFVKRDEIWRVDGSSSESASPSSPASESLGGLRHTRDRLKLDLPPSPHAASPKHARVFSFALEMPKRREVITPLVMTDETPVMPPLPLDETVPPPPEPTFSTFGKTATKTEPEQKIILTDETAEAETESPKVVEAVKGEGTVLDSGDEDSGIESSSKATLERNGTPNVS